MHILVNFFFVWTHHIVDRITTLLNSNNRRKRLFIIQSTPYPLISKWESILHRLIAIFSTQTGSELRPRGMLIPLHRVGAALKRK